jgi:Holliday junction resolvasome RuvABC endonuclease subunit
MEVVLSLDLSLKTGFTVGLFPCGEVLSSGTVYLSGDTWPTRLVQLRNWLRSTCRLYAVERIYYEEVHRHEGALAARSFYSIWATMMMVSKDMKIAHPRGLEVAMIKQTATGKGNARKEAMMRQAAERWPEIVLHDDNHADALWIFEAARLLSAGKIVIPETAKSRRAKKRKATTQQANLSL